MLDFYPMKKRNDLSIEENNNSFISLIVTKESDHEKDTGYLVEDKSFQQKG